MGFLLPPSLRFINYSYSMGAQRSAHRFQKYTELISFLDETYRERVKLNRPYYQDPYGKDRPQTTVMAVKTNPYDAKSRNKKDDGKGTARTKLLKLAMEEASLRRENQRQEDAVLWGRQSEDEQDFYYDVKPVPPKAVNSQLAKPKTVKIKSEWTKNTELSMAASRKKDIEDKVVRRIEKHHAHGDVVRMTVCDQVADRLARLVTHIDQKDQKSAEIIKKIKEKQHPA